MIVSADRMAIVLEATAFASAVDILTLSFCENKKGITRFAKALIEVDQSYSSSETFNIEILMQCGKAV